MSEPAYTICGFEVHEDAERFPLLDGDDFEQLKESMRRHGWLSTHPMVLHEGKILDGRNRGLAAEEVGVAPVTVEWAGEYGTPRLYIFAVNVVRRHLSTAERIRFCMIFEPDVAAHLAEKKAAALDEHRPKGRKNGKSLLPPDGGNTKSKPREPTAAEMVAKTAGIPARTYERGKRVATEAPDLFADVEAGKVSLAAAEREVAERKQKKLAPPRLDTPKPVQWSGERPKRARHEADDDIEATIGRAVKKLRKNYPRKIPTIIAALRAAAQELARCRE